MSFLQGPVVVLIEANAPDGIKSLCESFGSSLLQRLLIRWALQKHFNKRANKHGKGHINQPCLL